MSNSSRVQLEPGMGQAGTFPSEEAFFAILLGYPPEEGLPPNRDLKSLQIEYLQAAMKVGICKKLIEKIAISKGLEWPLVRETMKEEYPE